MEAVNIYGAVEKYWGERETELRSLRVKGEWCSGGQKEAVIVLRCLRVCSD